MLTRLHLAAGLALIAAFVAPLAYAQQDPNAPATKGARGGGGPGGPGGPGGGGPGGPGGPGGGFGGFGGPGGPGGGWGGRGGGPGANSVEALIQNEAVQEDLKVDDKQKAKVKSLVDSANKERAKISEAIPKLAAQQAAAENAAMAEALAANGIVADPKALANANGGGRGGRGGPGGGNNQMERQMMNLAMTSLSVKVDAALLKVLDLKQRARIKQIALQQEGPRAFTTPNEEVVQKLGMTEEQLTEIRNVNGELRNNQRQSMQDLFASIVPPDASNNNNGGRGGRFPNMANLDEATRAKFNEQMQVLQTKNSNDSMAAIGKILSSGQKTTYKKMIGEAFDVSKLRTFGPGGPGGPGAPAAPATAATKAAAPTTAATKAATPADAAAAKPARKSLRDARGGN